jgi:hypothetical protein
MWLSRFSMFQGRRFLTEQNFDSKERGCVLLIVEGDNPAWMFSNSH